MSILLASTICGGASILSPTAALAQVRPAAGVNETLTFQIPAQSLPSAINAFIRQSGWQISYSPALARGKKSAAVSGAMTAAAALRQLVIGTGIEVRVGAPGSAALVELSSATGAISGDGATVLLPIVVRGARANSTMGQPPAAYAGGQVATGGQLGMLGNRDVMDTPFSQSNYTKKLIQDQQAQTVNEALANDPSVILASKNSWVMDGGVIRGQPAHAYVGSRSLNGLPGMAPLQYPSTDYIERIEVLKGPSGLLNGMQSGAYNLGGTINLVTKQAEDDPITNLTTRYTSNSQIGAHVDFGRRFGDANEFGIRFNGSLAGGDTPVDTQSSEDGVASLNLDYRGENVRLSVDLAHQSQIIEPLSFGISLWQVLPTLTNIPRPPSGATSLGPDWVDTRFKSTLGMVRGEIDITDSVTAYGAFGAQRFQQDGIDLWTDLLNADGRLEVTPRRVHNIYDVVSAQAGLRATATTGAVDHQLNLSMSQTRWESAYASTFGNVFNVDSMYDPVFPPPQSIGDPGDPSLDSKTTARSIGIADTFSMFDERVQFTAGLRYQEVESFSIWTGAYEKSAWTPAFGVVVKPWENVSLYANYIEGLQPGTTVGSAFSNEGDVFAPYITNQYEAGVKVDWGTITTTFAVFQSGTPSTISVASTDPLDPRPRLTTDGDTRTRGIEFSAFGEITDGVRVLGGLTLLDARTLKTNSGINDGQRAQGVPRVRAVLGGEWDTPFVEGLTLTSRVSYTSDQPTSWDRPDLKIPEYTVVDLGARYEVASSWTENPITVRFNVDNVFDKDHWKGMVGGNGDIYRGEPRTFRLSTEFKF